VLAVTVDAQGNVFVGGSLQTFVDFGGGHVLTNVGVADAFVAKLSPTGEHLWSHALGSALGFASLSGTGSFDVDSNGNLYVGVLFAGEITALGQTFDSDGDTDGDALLLVVTPDGELSRSEVWSSPGSDTVSDLVVDEEDAVTIALRTAGPVEVGGLLLPGGLGLAKLTADGDAVYARPTVVPASPLVRIARVPGASEVLLATPFLGSVDLGLGPVEASEPDTLLLARFDDVTGDALEQAVYPRTAQQTDGLLVSPTGDRLLASSSYEADFGQDEPFTGYTYVARLDANGAVKHLLPVPGRAVASTLLGEDLLFAMTVATTTVYESIPVDFATLLVRRAPDGALVSVDVFDASADGTLDINSLARAPDGVVVAGGNYIGAGFTLYGHTLPPATNTYSGFVARLAP
jgi:hypothetical protein